MSGDRGAYCWLFLEHFEMRLTAGKGRSWERDVTSISCQTLAHGGELLWHVCFAAMRVSSQLPGRSSLRGKRPHHSHPPPFNRFLALAAKKSTGDGDTRLFDLS